MGGGVVLQAQDREHDDADEDEDAEEILEESDDRPRADDRHGEVGDEQRSVRLEDRETQHEEAPECEHVREARDRPLEEFLLAEHLDGLGLNALGRVLCPARSRLAGAGEGEQEPPSLPGECEDDHCQGNPDDGAKQHVRIHGVRLSPIGRPRIGCQGLRMCAQASMLNLPRCEESGGG
ncbi:unannotated protein [freshwater metagenome]|uniref:Unannotated protein n=1 Tax=freshwater metagenome TaxID=449393 RepID=A0A6J7IHU2_9ZZZZ